MMGKKYISRSGFVSLRAVIALLLCASAFLIAVTTVPAFLHRQARAKLSERTLTFADRVARQRAIEEVYWHHRIWPKDNPGLKPPLDAVISQSQLENKVEDYLTKSQFVTQHKGLPITAGDLQAEMDRMASHTKQSDVLRELFEALGNDPFVVAECLARPALAERLINNRGVIVGVPPGRGNQFAADTADATANRMHVTMNGNDVEYKLPEISVSTDCTDDTWAGTTAVNAPDARWGHTAVWTGSEMIVWGGNDGGSTYFNTGSRYDPATDSWTATSTTDAPTSRWHHTAVWTGGEMIVWGGYGGNNEFLNSGGRYNPATDGWTATNASNSPTARSYHTAVWTSSEMLVWGGRNDVVRMNGGGRYNPTTDSWAPTNTINAPEARWDQTAIWTGSEMIVWGGTDETSYLHTGGKYNPSTDSWAPTGTVNVALGRVAHTAVWTGDEMIVWGGVDENFNETNTGSSYNPIMDSWTAISLVNAPSPRDSHSAVWTGSEMIVWGGVFCCPAIDFNTGGRYDAATDSWIATSTANAPLARWAHTAVWTGSEMLVWGGYNDPSNLVLDTGGRYCARSEATPTPTPIATPTPTPSATATATPRIAPTPRLRPTPHRRP